MTIPRSATNAPRLSCPYKIIGAAVRRAELKKSTEYNHTIALAKHRKQAVLEIAPRRHGVRFDRILAGHDGGNRPNGLGRNRARVAIPGCVAGKTCEVRIAHTVDLVAMVQQGADRKLVEDHENDRWSVRNARLGEQSVSSHHRCSDIRVHQKDRGNNDYGRAQ